MDQQTRIAGTYVFAILLFMIAFIFFCFGVGLMFSFPDIWSLGGVISLGFAGIFIHSGIKNLNDAKNFERDAALQVKAANIKEQSKTVADKKPETVDATTNNEILILANWQYSKEEWNTFMKWENNRRKSGILLETFVIAVFGSVILKFLRNAGWLESILISLAFAIIYWAGKSYIAKNAIGKAENNQVVITNRSVIINGKVNSFRDNLYWLKKVELLQEANIAVLEFVYAWNTRKGSTSEEIRVPVPKDKIEEASYLVKLY